MTERLPKQHRNLVISLVSIVVGMVMLSFAAVPLYDAFCRITGLGGTTKTASSAPNITAYGRPMTVRFNTDTAQDLTWEFTGPSHPIQLPIGKEEIVIFKAQNVGNEGMVGVATYNVTPHAAGEYFTKVECFCFDDQYLGAGESMDMPVSFYIDPAIAEDRDLPDLKTVTLSYTFFKSKNQRDTQ